MRAVMAPPPRVTWHSGRDSYSPAGMVVIATQPAPPSRLLQSDFPDVVSAPATGREATRGPVRVPDAPQMNVWSGLAEVSPAPPLTPATVVDVAVAAGEVAAGAGAAVGDAEAVGAAVAGVVTEVEVLPHPAAARAATPNTHDAMRRRVPPTKSPPG